MTNLYKASNDKKEAFYAKNGKVADGDRKEKGIKFTQRLNLSSRLIVL